MGMAKSRNAGPRPGTGRRGRGRRAGRGGVPQFMIAPCQSANERTPLLFIEITPAIDGCGAITPLVIASPQRLWLFLFSRLRRSRDQQLLLNFAPATDEIVYGPF
ncbi:hypothetical protein EVAR_75392_1 [Eumeta japonica]|uniref:Uncharacterized protein n=1 Tax=Eumeta variegata TaxID=151549 RepID=A0A4C1TMU0_EUMVA|nr:hypothetical protein EVAR_75392_1 [Eumeta japonica]